MTVVMDADAALRRINKYYEGIGKRVRYTSLKPKQGEALVAATDGDVLVVLPTGYGKTIIIEALPFLSATETTVLLCTPLNAIIEEQRLRFGDR